MRETGNVGVQKLLVPAHSLSQKEGVLQEDREAHGAEDKGAPVPSQSEWDAGQLSLALLDSPQKVWGSSLPQEGESFCLGSQICQAMAQTCSGEGQRPQPRPHRRFTCKAC